MPDPTPLPDGDPDLQPIDDMYIGQVCMGAGTDWDVRRVLPYMPQIGDIEPGPSVDLEL